MSRRTLGIILIVIAFGLLALIAYKNSTKRQVPISFSPRGELVALWEQYKKDQLEPESYRVLDKDKDNITTSEGESYALLQAVWLDDKASFDRSFKWTKDNLQRTNDYLFSWLFGEREDGTYGILLDQGGQNTASDGDVDIALALTFASIRWNDQYYLDQARQVIDAIWDNEVIYVNNKPYLAANNVEKTSTSPYIVMNPSYLAPYAFKVFAKIDPDHPWDAVADSSYEVINQSMDLALDKPSSAVIPPDWVFMNRVTGQITAPQGNTTLTTNTSYDALRTPFRLALDWQWFKDQRAKAILDKMSFFTEEWEKNSMIYTSYSHDGKVLEKDQTAAFYGGTIGYFLVSDTKNAQAVYNSKLQYLFNPDTNSWRTNLSYYDSNWAWFGIAQYNNLLPNLAQSLFSDSTN